MKMLKKLALVSAVSMISAGSFAMEAMDDETMSATTGQDGITILVKPGVLSATAVGNLGVTTTTQDMIDNPSAGYYANNDNSFNGLSIKQVVIHDNDGWTTAHGGTAGTTDNSGALVIGDGTAADSTVVIADGSKPIVLDIDMVGDNNGTSTGGGKAMLNVRISTPRLGIKVGSIGIADSYNKGTDGVDDSSAIAIGTALDSKDADNSGTTDGNAHRGRVTIMNGMEIVMGEATTNIQLGGESQGAMIVMNTQLIGGLSIAGFSLNDTAGVCNNTTTMSCTAPTGLGEVITGGGSIYVGSLTMQDAGGSNLTVKANIDVGSANTQPYNATSTPILTDVNSNLATAIASINQVPVSVRDSVTSTVTSGATTTYAALLDTADGADNILGNADDDATATGQLNTVNTNAIAGVRASSLSTLQAGAQSAYNGLVVQLAQLGDATNGADLALNNVRVGDSAAATIGDIQILGLNINGTTLVIKGH